MDSLCFKIKVTFGHKLRYEIKVRFGDISLKLHQTNRNIVRNNVNVIVDELVDQLMVFIAQVGFFLVVHDGLHLHSVSITDDINFIINGHCHAVFS